MAVFFRDPAPQRAAIEACIRHALEDARSMLPFQPARLELVSFGVETGEAVLEVEGGCADCDLSVVNFVPGLEPPLRLRVPAVRTIRLLVD